MLLDDFRTGASLTNTAGTATALVFTFEAGVLVRRSAKQALQLLGWRYHLTVDIEEARGWLSSVLRVRFSGNADDLQNFAVELTALKSRW